jgi:hypothetical protein
VEEYKGERVSSDECEGAKSKSLVEKLWLARVAGDTPPRVFYVKSLELLDYKGVEFFGDDKEFARVSE